LAGCDGAPAGWSDAHALRAAAGIEPPPAGAPGAPAVGIALDAPLGTAVGFPVGMAPDAPACWPCPLGIAVGTDAPCARRQAV
jgi:hypothetical protein